MRQNVEIVVVLPVGPTGSYPVEILLDTLDSVTHYVSASQRTIVINNSGQLLGPEIWAHFPDVIVMDSPEPYGMSGALYKALSLAYLYAYTSFRFKLLLKLDTDALFIDHGLEDAALDFLCRHPNVGQFGTYRVGANGERSEYSWPSQQLGKETGALGLLTDYERWRTLRALVRQACRHGYESGEHILGGSYFLSWNCIHRFVVNGYLLQEGLTRSKLQEDHLFSLLVKACGMDLGDFGGPDDPMAVRWRGLPMSPEELVQRGKKIIHSTRFWADMSEPRIRAYYRSRRRTREQSGTRIY